VVLILLGAVITMSLKVYRGGTEDSVKTKQLELVDNNGVSRALLTTVSGGRPSLTLLDSNGQNRALLFLSDDGSPNLVLVDNGRFVIMDAAGQVRSAQRVDASGSPILTLHDSNGQTRTLLRLNPTGDAVQEIHDASGNVIWSALPTPAP
jgi:hypothetical protein